MKRLAALCGALVLTLAMAASATAAGAPVVYYDMWVENEYQVDEAPVDAFPVEPIDCGFPVMMREAGRQTYRVWFNKDGSPKKGHWQYKGTNSLYPVDDTDRVVSGHFSVSVQMREMELIGSVFHWKAYVSGNYWGSQLPGSGNAYHQAGRLSEIVSREGDDFTVEIANRVGLFAHDPEALCAALDPS